MYLDTVFKHLNRLQDEQEKIPARYWAGHQSFMTDVIVDDVVSNQGAVHFELKYNFHSHSRGIQATTVKCFYRDGKWSWENPFGGSTPVSELDKFEVLAPNAQVLWHVMMLVQQTSHLGSPEHLELNLTGEWSIF